MSDDEPALGPTALGVFLASTAILYAYQGETVASLGASSLLVAVVLTRWLLDAPDLTEDAEEAEP